MLTLERKLSYAMQCTAQSFHIFKVVPLNSFEQWDRNRKIEYTLYDGGEITELRRMKSIRLKKERKTVNRGVFIS